MRNCPQCGAATNRGEEACSNCGYSVNSAEYCLVGLPGPFAGCKFTISPKGLQIGRIPDQNELVIADTDISRQHATLKFSDGTVNLTDSSGNGTFVNGQRITDAVVRPGDRIRFGLKAENTFVLQAIPAAVAAAAGFGPSLAPDRPSNTAFATPSIAPAANTLVMSQHESASPQRRLQLILDQYAVRDIPITDAGLEFGREEGAHKIAINHSSISARHARLSVVDSNVILADLQSRNGTFVNGERVKERALREGDLIQLGACDSHLFLYRETGHRPVVLRDIELDRPLVSIGRAADNRIQIEHPTVSAHHAHIRKLPNDFELIDLGSTNGTFINGERISRQILRPSNRISLGAAQFVFDGKRMEQQSDGSRVGIYCRSLRVDARDFKTGAVLRLLDDVSLDADPCEFVGLLGPSGAGKTTLMDAMNGSRPAQYGQVLLNSANLYTEFASLRSTIGYVPQEDILHRQLTVKECLYFAARLRLPDDFGEPEIWKRVNETIKILELSDRADLQIAQLSGGQRKRVSLGIELLSKPAVLFADEPTAGQDPRTELKMMQLFREIANRGSTVVINTHLLGSFSLLDKVAVLIRGKLAYFGPSQDMLPYFEANRPHEIFEKLQEKTPDEWATHYRQSRVAAESASGPSSAKEPVRRAPGKVAKPSTHSSRRQLSTLLKRQFTLKFKDKTALAAMLLPPMAIAALMALLKQGPNEPKVLFMVVVVALWFGCSGAVREIVDEMPVYKRERQRDLKLASYIGSKLVYVMLVAAAQAFVLIAVLRLMGALDGHLWEACLLTWIITIEGGLIGLLISAICSTAERALYVFPLTMIPQLLLAGLLIPTIALTPFRPVHSASGQVLGVQELPRTPAMISVLANGVSPLMVSRWGLEGLADLYVHDRESNSPIRKAYGYDLVSSVAITLHPRDSAEARSEVEMAVAGNGNAQFQSDRSSLLDYIAVLGTFCLAFVTAIGVALRRKEVYAGRG